MSTFSHPVSDVHSVSLPILAASTLRSRVPRPYLSLSGIRQFSHLTLYGVDFLITFMHRVGGGEWRRIGQMVDSSIMEGTRTTFCKNGGLVLGMRWNSSGGRRKWKKMTRSMIKTSIMVKDTTRAQHSHALFHDLTI